MGRCFVFFVWYSHGLFATAITLVVVNDLIQLLPFVSVLHGKFCTVVHVDRLLFFRNKARQEESRCSNETV